MLLVHERTLYPILLLCITILASCVSPPPASSPGMSISMTPSTGFRIETDRVGSVTATVVGGESDVTYSSSNVTVAAVDPMTGEIWGRSPGTAMISATAVADPRATGSVQVTVVAGPPIVPLHGANHADTIASLINEVCPNDEEQLFADSVPIETDLRVVHEFHDCQRLIENNEYKSLVGIFAHRNVTTYPAPIQYMGGKLVALILNFRTKTNWLPYTPLGLAPGTNCLVLKFTPHHVPPFKTPVKTNRAQRQTVNRGKQPARSKGHATVSGTWQAAIVHRPSTTSSYGDCSDKMNWDTVDATPPAQKYMLTVKPQPDAWEPDGTGTISPPVARWDWDSVKGENYLGVRCGKHGWCEIGDSATFTPLPALKEKGKNIYKGYYDQQYLATEKGTKSDVWGTVRPGQDAIVRGRIKRQDDTWWDAAKLVLEAPINGSTAFSWYTGKLSMPIVVDQVAQVRRGEGTMTIHSPEANKGQDWQMKINGSSTPAGGTLKFRGHPSEKDDRFGTVRWRWNEDDETVWSFCEEAGCCEAKRW